MKSNKYYLLTAEKNRTASTKSKEDVTKIEKNQSLFLNSTIDVIYMLKIDLCLIHKIKH